MADPISIAASIVGLLTAAAKVSEVLESIIRKARRAPKLIHDVLGEVSSIQKCLRQVDHYLSSDFSDLGHARLLLVEDIRVTFSECVMVFAKLEQLLGSLNLTQPLQASFRARWTLREHEIQRLLNRLKSSQAALHFMMTTITW